MKFEHTEVHALRASIRGMRNPLESHHKSDSLTNEAGQFIIGPEDMKLAQKLVFLETNDHSKFLRQIGVTVDISASLYWWTSAKKCFSVNQQGFII